LIQKYVAQKYNFYFIFHHKNKTKVFFILLLAAKIK